jgi:hypothetical protein
MQFCLLKIKCIGVKIFAALPILILVISAQAQSINNNWKQELNKSLEQFLQCGSATASKSECSTYSAKALNVVYRINDFYSQKSGRYMTINEISEFLKNSDRWISLGKPYDQKILETAQVYANTKKAVVAVYQNAQGIGHIVLITPGQLQLSGSWGMKVPNGASFLTTEPHKSFIDKALSFAFAKNMMKDVTIYGRIY